MPISPEVLCAGIIVSDHVSSPISRLPKAGELVLADSLLLTIGGCAANAAVDLAKMRVATAVVGRVGEDVFGGVVTGMLREHGLDVGQILATPGVDTSQTLIVNVQGEDRRFIHTFGANAHFQAADIALDRYPTAKVLYVGGYLVMPRLIQEDLAALFARARERGIQTVLDVVVPGPGSYLDRFEKLLPVTDVFLPNNEEAAVILGEDDPRKQAERFRAMGAKTVVITMGGSGAILVNDKEKLRSGVFAVPFVDGSGGGDAFDAGYICGLLRGLDARGCLTLASALGASCVRAIGTTPGVFRREECEEFLGKNRLTIETL